MSYTTQNFLLLHESNVFAKKLSFFSAQVITGVRECRLDSANSMQGRRHGFLSGGTNRRRVSNLPHNTLKIGKGTGFGPLHS